jgi:hypothetical protein
MRKSHGRVRLDGVRTLAIALVLGAAVLGVRPASWVRACEVIEPPAREPEEVPCPLTSPPETEGPFTDTTPAEEEGQDPTRSAAQEWDALLEKLRRQQEHVEQVDHGHKAEDDHFLIRAHIDAARKHLAEARMCNEEVDVERLLGPLRSALAMEPCYDSVRRLLEDPERPLHELLQHRDDRVRSCAYALVRAGYCVHRANERPSLCKTCPP